MIHADSESVRSVAQALNTFEEAIEEAKNTLRSAVSSARDGWPDANGERAEQEVEELINSIQISEEAQRIANDATTLADKLDEL